MINECYVGDVRDGLRAMIAAGVRAQTCVTSPPYWGLRDYGTASWSGGDPECEHSSVRRGHGDEKQATSIGTSRDPIRASDCPCGAVRVDSQLGLEPTVAEYVENMAGVFRLLRDVLADDGTLWLNMGDCYHNGDKGAYARSRVTATDSLQVSNLAANFIGAPNRNPQAGLKPKDLVGMPWRLAFALQADGWYLRQDIIWSKPNPMPESITDRCTKSHEYLFLLSKRERYYFDQEAIAEPSAYPGDHRALRTDTRKDVEPMCVDGGSRKRTGNPTRETRNKRSVWHLATQPYSDAHFATFPRALVAPCIIAGSRVGDVVLDPFLGSGTVAQVAQSLGRRWIGCELNPEYVEMQKRRAAQTGLELHA